MGLGLKLVLRLWIGILSVDEYSCDAGVFVVLMCIREGVQQVKNEYLDFDSDVALSMIQP